MARNANTKGLKSPKLDYPDNDLSLAVFILICFDRWCLLHHPESSDSHGKNKSTKKFASKFCVYQMLARLHRGLSD